MLRIGWIPDRSVGTWVLVGPDVPSYDFGWDFFNGNNDLGWDGFPLLLSYNNQFCTDMCHCETFWQMKLSLRVTS